MYMLLLVVLAHLLPGDWLEGKKEGRGSENSSVGSYEGQWKNDLKNGSGEERTLVGTIFTGTWDRNRKHNRGIRKLVTGTVEEQVCTFPPPSSLPPQRTSPRLNTRHSQRP